MAEDSTPGRSWGWLRAFLLGERDVTLRDQIEDAIDEHEGDSDAPAKGDLSPEIRDMVRKVLHLGELRVDDVAVQRGDIIAVPETLGFDELVKAFADAGHSRLPVYRDSLDTIIGMVHIKDVFAILATGATPPKTLAPLLRQPRYVPLSMGVLDLLADMRQSQTHLAIVIDEYSGTAFSECGWQLGCRCARRTR
jgi:magnesium and cobalt transporter